jgi:NAD(P)-dependent dehydrogenase (short-subunit alcohol dehydrogenase family)
MRDEAHRRCSQTESRILIHLEGAKVVASARRRAEIEALVAEIKNEGFEPTDSVADTNIEQNIVDLVHQTVATYGLLDIAFNNAGAEGAFSPFVDQANETYETIFNANVRGIFWCMKHKGKAMLAQGTAPSSITLQWEAS